MKATKTPVAFFTYNRPLHTDRSLEALLRCSRLDECRLFIYCDGPKDPDQADAVAASRRVVHKWAQELEAEVTERPANLGLARSIVSGVTELCQKYGRVIVLEDDLVVAPDFIDFMLQGLDRYHDADKVLQVSGSMLAELESSETDACFLPLTTTWGWATWERAWRIFDWTASGALNDLADPNRRTLFDLGGGGIYSQMLKDRLAGRNDSWGILWWYAVFQAEGLVLYPRKSLVMNCGFDGSGVHCGQGPGFGQAMVELDQATRLPRPIRFPKEVSGDEEAFQRLKDTMAGCVDQTPLPKSTTLSHVYKSIRRWGRFLKQ